MPTSELVIPPGADVVLPPHGFVHLQKICADDLDVVNAARVSFAKQSKWYWICGTKLFDNEDDAWAHQDSLKAIGERAPIHGPQLASDDEGVLRFLLRHRHGTPFEHNFFKWHVRAPIFVFREWHRHRIGVSINEESARYSPLAADFYVPALDAIRTQQGKPGRYVFERIEDKQKALMVQAKMEALYASAYEVYSDLMDDGVAKEIARAVLPVGIYSQMLWSCNARSLMNFLSLRAAPTALYEIRVYAEAMERVFTQAMPITHDEFVQNDRVAP